MGRVLARGVWTFSSLDAADVVVAGSAGKRWLAETLTALRVGMEMEASVRKVFFSVINVASSPAISEDLASTLMASLGSKGAIGKKPVRHESGGQ
jgi:hypothetical protein